jgi:hypothetical protein
VLFPGFPVLDGAQGKLQAIRDPNLIENLEEVIPN